MTPDKLLTLEGDELSRALGEVLQPEANHKPSYGKCKICDKVLWYIIPAGQTQYEAAYYEPCIPSIPLTPAEAFKWRDWAVEKFGERAYLEASCFSLGHEMRSTVITNLIFVHGESVFWRCFARPEHYLKAAALCVSEAKK